MSFHLDFSFLSQEDKLESGGAHPQAPIEGGSATARDSETHGKSSVASHEAPPLVAQLRPPLGLGPAAEDVADSWTVWDSNRQPPGGKSKDGTGARGTSPCPGVVDAAPAGGGSSFTRAFAHMKERPGYEPPKQAQGSRAQGGQGAAAKAPSARTIQVSRRQTNNPVLKMIRNVPWEYADVVPDYQMGTQTCCLFLSLKYHLLKPKYIYARMEALQRGYRLRVLLCMVDTEDNTKTLIDVHKVAVVNGWTLILAWSPEEAARYLETYQTYEHKQADAIQQRIEGDYLSRLTDVLTTIRSVNRTDVANLSTSLGSLATIMNASKQRLALCPGVGGKKVERIHEAFHQPFISSKKPRTESSNG